MNTKDICTYYRSILERIKTESPDTKIYIQSVLPVTDPIQSINDTIVVLNQKLKNLSDEKSLTYINLFDSFKDEKGFLKKDLTNDGLHLTGKAYLIWKSLIDEYVNN
jgi:lysophospholipase L1-like esterase